jgi:hypothetical protein
MVIRACSLLIPVLALAILSSCSKPKDEQVPVISSVTTGGMQHGVELHALAGAINYFDITASDDQSLKVVRCRLFSAADYHTHTMIEGSTNPAFQAPNTGSWEVEKSVDLSGTEMNEVIKFGAPKDLSGRWEIEVGVMDEEGNIGYYTNGVIIQNDSMPAIFPTASYPLPRADGVIELSPNQPLIVDGNILDINFIQQVDVSFSREGSVVWNQSLNPINTWLFEMSELTIIGPETPGIYRLRIAARDFANWTSEVFATIEIK